MAGKAPSARSGEFQRQTDLRSRIGTVDYWLCDKSQPS